MPRMPRLPRMSRLRVDTESVESNDVAKILVCFCRSISNEHESIE